MWGLEARGWEQGAVEAVAVVGVIALIYMAAGKATGLAVMAVNKV